MGGATGAVQQRQVDLVDGGAEAAQHVDSGLTGGLDLGVAAGPEEVAGEADAQAVDAAAELAGEVFEGLVGGSGVAGVVAGDGVEHEGGVLDGAGERADVVERPGKRDHAAAPDAAVGRLEADDAAEGGGEADRATGVAAERAEGGAGRDRGGAAAGAATGHAGRVPGVGDRAVVRVDAGGAHGELVQVELAHEHGAGVVELAGHEGVFLWDTVAEEVGAGGGGDARRIDDVLECDGDAVEGSAVAAGAKLVVGLGGLPARQVGGPSDEGVDGGLGRLGASEDGIGESGSGEGAVAEGGGGLLDSELVRRRHRLGGVSGWGRHRLGAAGRGGRGVEEGCVSPRSSAAKAVNRSRSTSARGAILGEAGVGNREVGGIGEGAEAGESLGVDVVVGWHGAGG